MGTARVETGHEGREPARILVGREAEGGKDRVDIGAGMIRVGAVDEDPIEVKLDLVDLSEVHRPSGYRDDPGDGLAGLWVVDVSEPLCLCPARQEQAAERERRQEHVRFPEHARTSPKI